MLELINTSKSIEELINTIKREKPYVDIKPYSHNIIMLCLQMLHRDHNISMDKMNKLIIDLGLHELGW